MTTTTATTPPSRTTTARTSAFYVLEGEYEFLVGGRALKAEAGSLLYVPKGTLHAHKNVGENLGRLLATQTPGGLYERIFEQVGEAVDGYDGGSPAFEERSEAGKRIVEVAAEHGMEIPSPTTQVSRSRHTIKAGARIRPSCSSSSTGRGRQTTRGSPGCG